MKRLFKKFTAFSLALFLLVSVLPTQGFAAPPETQMVGGVNLSGDFAIDSEQLADNTSGQPRWLSYPGTRLCLNANVNGSNLEGPMASNLPIKLGGIIGTTTYRFSNIMGVKVSSTGGTAKTASSVSTTWYPYKIDFNSSYSSPNVAISGYDFFADNLDSIIRVMNVSGSASKDVVLDGTIYGSGAQWLSNDKVLLITHNGYYYALKFVELDSSNNVVDLSVIPTITGTSWSLRIPCGAGTKKIAVGFGFAARSAETSSDAVQRAKNCFNQSVAQKLQTTKDYYDTLLRTIPAPTSWGINYVSAGGVTPEQHKLKYYEAWTFVLSNYVRDLPDDSYPYAQVLCGKPSLYDGGSPNSRGTCTWESLFGQQLLAYVMPNEAWSAFEGVMSNVAADGTLSGECLPSRKAQTAWFLYAKTDDQAKLSNVYPAIKRYLIWREANPRWIYESSNIPDEKDMEFVVSWLRDVDYVIKICDALGLTEDKAMWQTKQSNMMDNFRTWFITPTKIYQYYFTDSSQHYYSYRNTDLPSMIITALDIRNMPDDLATIFKNYYLSYHNASATLGGFNTIKYPGSDLVMNGLLEHQMFTQFREFVNINLRESVKNSPFSERIDLSGTGSVSEGVKPSLFTACMVITSTWLANNMRVDTGYPVQVVIPAQSVNLALNKAVTASSVESGTAFTAGNAVDGSNSTRWASDYSDPQWLSIDLGQTTTFNKIVLNWEAAYASGYKIQTSADGANWSDVYTNTSGDGGEDQISISSTSARYVRMYGTARATGYGYSLWKFSIYNVTSSN